MSHWINRAAIVVRPGRPYVEWASSLDDEAPDHAQMLEKRVSIYLVGGDPDEKEETAPLERYYKKIFEAELAAWSINKDDWPKERTLALFLRAKHPAPWYRKFKRNLQETFATENSSGPIWTALQISGPRRRRDGQGGLSGIPRVLGRVK